MRPAHHGDDTAHRYARHLSLDGFGERAQARLSGASVLVVGAGGLGSPVLTYLAGSGVGRLVVMDPDTVELSNLPRQLIHTEAALGGAKADSAARAIAASNSAVEVVALRERLDVPGALELVADADVVVDCTDSVHARYVLNDACVLLGVPLVWASIAQYAGQFGVVEPGVGPCYRCVFPDPGRAAGAATCEEAGVLAVLPGVLGTMQAVEVVKLCTGLGRVAGDAIRLYDALSATMTPLPASRDPRCRVCGLEDGFFDGLDDVLRDAVDAPGTREANEIAPQQWPRTPHVVVDVRGPAEVRAAPLPTWMTTAAQETFDEPWNGGWSADTGAAVRARAAGRDVVLVCARGARSSAAARALEVMDEPAMDGPATNALAMGERVQGEDAGGDLTSAETVTGTADGRSARRGRVLSLRGGLAALES